MSHILLRENGVGAAKTRPVPCTRDGQTRSWPGSPLTMTRRGAAEETVAWTDHLPLLPTESQVLLQRTYDPECVCDQILGRITLWFSFTYGVEYLLHTTYILIFLVEFFT